MASFRSAWVVAGIMAAILLSGTAAFARGGRGGGMGGGNRGGYSGGGQNAAPTVDPKIAADRQAITAATDTLTKATTEYSKKVKEFSDDFKKQDDYVAAKKALDDAIKEQDDAKAAVVKKLSTDDSDYKAAAAKLASGKKKLETLRSSGGTRDAISAQSTANFAADTSVGKLEENAEATDPACVAAKKKVDDARAVVDALDAKLADAIKNDDTLKGLKATVDSARTALTDANKKLQTDRGG